MKTQKNRHLPPRRQTFMLDPYIVDGTWTREELLRARGITAKPASRSTRSRSSSPLKAA